MRLRRWISIAATLGVLLHAGFLVRHSLSMADATRQYHAILADLASLCRAGPGEATVPASDLPRLPQGGWHSLADLGHYGVRVIDKNAFPAPGAQGYAFLQRSYHRNLYRIPLP